LGRDCPLKEDDEKIEEVKYGEGRPFQGYNSNGYRTGYNRAPYGERRPNLEDTINKYLEDSRKKQEEQDEWLKNFQEATNKSLANHDESLKNLETMIGKLAEDIHERNVIEESKRAVRACMAMFADNKEEDHPKGFKNQSCEEILQREEPKDRDTTPCQLPTKEDSMESFILPYTIGDSNLSALADLGSSINVMPLSLFLSLKLTSLRKTSLVIEMADMKKATPIGAIDNVLVKIDRFLFPVDFVVIDMANTPREDLILERPFLATSRARINVFEKEISLGVDLYNERSVFNMEKTNMQRHEDMANSKLTNSVVKEDPPDTFGIPGEVFNYMIPLCLKIAHDVDPVLRDESEESSKEDNDEGVSSFDPWQGTKSLIVTVVSHCCELKESIEEGKRTLIPSCSPFNKSCNGGGNIRLRHLRREANFWACYEEPDFDKSQWLKNYFNGINSREDVEWTFIFVDMQS
jgi:hypothetical protein